MEQTSNSTAQERKKQELRAYYESNLFEFAKYINPHYMYGDIHERVFAWLSSPEASLNQLLLLPRGHLKSHCIAVWVVWTITKEPWSTTVYLSAGDDLATVQMYSIKNMLLSPEYRLLWPEMVNTRENDRDKWATWAINVDHPARKARGIRDYTLIIKTVKSNATGLHCDNLVLDDVVVPANAYTATGRNEVESAVADFSSIKNTSAVTKAVGTRYHEKDVYGQFIEAELPLWNSDSGTFEGFKKQWDVLEAVVETSGDGTGEFLWPRVKSPLTGVWYGFDPEVLAMKKTEYFSLGKIAQFFAQYYNDPNASGSQKVDKDKFKYYKRSELKRIDGDWYVFGRKLALFAGMDLAWSDDTGAKGRSDYSAIAVIGLDSEGYIYILDLTQFKTSQFQVYYNHIINMHLKWGFRKMRIETNSAGKLVKQEVDRLIRQNGQALVLDGKTFSGRDGSKEERHAIVLEPRYESGTVYHYEGGYIKVLEEQLIQARPANDDLKDGVTIAIEISKPPGKSYSGSKSVMPPRPPANTRFGGRRAR